MANKGAPSDIREIWQSQQVEGIQMPLEEIRQKAGKFRSKILRRNLREYVAALAVIVFFGYCFVHSHDALSRAAFGLNIAGMLYVVYQLHMRGSARSLPADWGLESCLEFHRRELERQRDLLRGVWRWYLGPLVPGLVLIEVGIWRGKVGNVSHAAVSLILIILGVAAVFVLIGKMNQRAAAMLQRRIDELDALQR